MPNTPEAALPFKIGADPEFCMLDPENHLLTPHLLEDDFGQDGVLTEIRPDPANTISGFIANLKTTLLQGIRNHYGIFDWLTLSQGSVAAGGHIHLELPSDHPITNDIDDNGSESEAETKYAKQFYSFYAPIALGENHTNLWKRRRTGYGAFNDIRIEEKNSGNTTMEIRTPTAEWLTTPKIAAAVLAYCAVIHNEILFHSENISRLSFVAKTKTQMKLIEQICFSSQPNSLIKPLLRKIRWAVRRFELYPRYQKEISWLFQPTKILKEKERVGFDIIKGWKLPLPKITGQNFRQPPTTQANLSNILNRINESFIRTNQENKLGPFRDALANRIAAYGWKPKHRYILFGLKTGINRLVAANDQLDILNGQPTTQEEQERLASIFMRMRKRYNAASKYPRVFIGIPRAMRDQNNTRPLLQFVQHLEFTRSTPRILCNIAAAVPGKSKPRKQTPPPLHPTCECEECREVRQEKRPSKSRSLNLPACHDPQCSNYKINHKT